MGERGKLPAAKVCSKKNHSFGAGISFFVVLEPIVDHDLIDVLERIPGKLTDLRQLAPQRGKDSAQNVLALSFRFFRKGKFEITHAHTPQADMQQIERLGKRNGKEARKSSRQNTQNFDERPGRRVFQFSPHGDQETKTSGEPKS